MEETDPNTRERRLNVPGVACQQFCTGRSRGELVVPTATAVPFRGSLGHRFKVFVRNKHYCRGGSGVGSTTTQSQTHSMLLMLSSINCRAGLHTHRVFHFHCSLLWAIVLLLCILEISAAIATQNSRREPICFPPTLSPSLISRLIAAVNDFEWPSGLDLPWAPTFRQSL